MPAVRVMMTVPSAEARLHHLVPLGWALRTAGHEVLVAGRPTVTETITWTGLAAVAVGGGAEPGECDEWLADSRAVNDLVDFAALWRPDMVIWDECARRLGRGAHLRAASVRMLGIFGQVSTEAGQAETTQRLGACLAQLRVPADQALVAGHLTLDSMAPSMRLPAGPGHLPLRYVPYAGPAVFPAWLRRKPRRLRICLVFAGAGTVPAELFDAVGGLEAEVICALSADQIPAGTSLADNVRLVGAVPLNALLPTCSALVHDGTAVAMAMAHGVPQLTLTAGPARAGTRLAQQLASRGAGLLAGPEKRAAGPLAELISQLIADSGLRDHAAQLQAEMLAMPSPREIVPELVELAVRR